jgi:hypothetical protein
VKGLIKTSIIRGALDEIVAKSGKINFTPLHNHIQDILYFFNTAPAALLIFLILEMTYISMKLIKFSCPPPQYPAPHHYPSK